MAGHPRTGGIKPKYLLAFREFDPDASGLVTKQQLRHGLATLGCDLGADGQHTLEEMFLQSDNRVDYFGLLQLACGPGSGVGASPAVPRPPPDTHDSPSQLPEPAEVPLGVTVAGLSVPLPPGPPPSSPSPPASPSSAGATAGDGEAEGREEGEKEAKEKQETEQFAADELEALGLSLSSPVRRRLFETAPPSVAQAVQAEVVRRLSTPLSVPPSALPPSVSQPADSPLPVPQKPKQPVPRSPPRTAPPRSRPVPPEASSKAPESYSKPPEASSKPPEPDQTAVEELRRRAELAELDLSSTVLALQRKEVEKVKLQRQVRAAQTGEQAAKAASEELRQQVENLERELAGTKVRIQAGLQAKGRLERRCQTLERQLSRPASSSASSAAPAPVPVPAPAPAPAPAVVEEEAEGRVVARLRVQLNRRTAQCAEQESEIKALKAALEQLRASERPREIASLRASLASVQARLAEAERRAIEAPKRPFVVERAAPSPSQRRRSPPPPPPRRAKSPQHKRVIEEEDLEERVLPSSVAAVVAQAQASPDGTTSRVRAYALKREKLREARRRLASRLDSASEDEYAL